MGEALFFILNHADDLHISSSMENTLRDMKRVLESKVLLNGDGEANV
jgi:hypothetical protein